MSAKAPTKPSEFQCAVIFLRHIRSQVSWVTNQIRLLTSALHAIKFLRIYVQDRPSEDNHKRVSEEHEMACTRLLIDSASLLEDLEICRWRLTQINRIPFTTIFGHTANPAHVPRTLRCLLLYDIDFCYQESELFNIIHVNALHLLELKCCDGIGPFLYALAASFRRVGTQLKVLIVWASADEVLRTNMNIAQRVNALLCSFTDLEELELVFSSCCFLDWKGSLCTHQESLKRLLISSLPMAGSMESVKCPGKIASILAQCPHVQQFAYSPRVPYLGKAEDCKLPCALDAGLIDRLDPDAAALNIRVLRLLYAPGF